MSAEPTAAHPSGEIPSSPLSISSSSAVASMGVLRIDNEVKPRRNAHEVSTLFPRRIASRAARFSVVEALDLDALVEQYGPEI